MSKKSHHHRARVVSAKRTKRRLHKKTSSHLTSHAKTPTPKSEMTGTQIFLLNMETLHKSSHFIQAVLVGDKDLLTEEIQKNKNVDVIDEDGRAGIFLAVATRAMWRVELFLQHKFKVDVVDKYERTPLMYALNNGDTDIANVLQKAGSDVLAKDSNGDGIVEWAKYGRNDEATEWAIAEHNKKSAEISKQSLTAALQTHSELANAGTTRKI